MTLSNVCCLDFDEAELRAAFSGSIRAHYASCQLGHAKPDPSAFRAVAAREQVPIGALLHIGDDWECDVLGALDAGARAIWISGDRTPPVTAGIGREGRLAIVRDMVDAVDRLSQSLMSD